MFNFQDLIIEEFSKDPSDCDDPDDPSDKCAKGQTCCKLSTGNIYKLR